MSCTIFLIGYHTIQPEQPPHMGLKMVNDATVNPTKYSPVEHNFGREPLNQSKF